MYFQWWAHHLKIDPPSGLRIFCTRSKMIRAYWTVTIRTVYIERQTVQQEERRKNLQDEATQVSRRILGIQDIQHIPAIYQCPTNQPPCTRQWWTCTKQTLFQCPLVSGCIHFISTWITLVRYIKVSFRFNLQRKLKQLKCCSYIKLKILKIFEQKVYQLPIEAIKCVIKSNPNKSSS